MPYGSFTISVPQKCSIEDVFFDKNDHMRQPLEALIVAIQCQNLFDEIMKELSNEAERSVCERKKEEIKRAVEHLAETVNKQPEDVLRGLVVLYATTTLYVDQRLTDLAVADIAWLRTFVETKGAYLPPPCLPKKDLKFLLQLLDELI